METFTLYFRKAETAEEALSAIGKTIRPKPKPERRG